MKITVRKKLILGFLAIAILIAIVGRIALINLNKINNACHLAGRQSLIASYSNQIEIAILECRRAEKNFWLRREDKYINEVKKQVDRIKENIALIREKNPGKDLNNQVDKIVMLSDEYYEEFIKSASLFKSGRAEKEIFAENNRFVIVSRELQNLAPQIAKEARIRMENEIKTTEETKITSSRIIAIGTITAVAAGFLIAFFISKNFTKSIGKLMHTMKKIEEGNLEARVDIKSRDEVGALGNFFNKMLNKLEEGRNEQRVLQQQVANAEKLASLGRLAAGVAHEINNPLTGVLTSGHLLLKKTPEDVPEREDLEIIVKETTRCRRIIKGLLDFARQTKPEMKLSDINEIIGESLSLIKNQASFHNIKIIKELSRSLPLVSVDPNQIKQVFINVIINAQEAMPDGGFLTISSAYKDRFIEVKFIDTGCGIPEENIGKLFDPFFTTKEESKGTGLGLAVSYGIIEGHQGSIEVESKSGQGTTVIVKLVK
ncbi:MAG: HAMP domain-containing protein [Candidatus Omnitrophica bacterium]|nr:HAMP domain-containing protein [Candidatus Omnitrophota bacterium]